MGRLPGIKLWCRGLWGLALALALALGAGSASAAESPAIAAAADLKFALPEVSALFSRETGLTVRLTFGSSGNMSRQIAQGAPFELFFSASEDYVRFLADRSLTEGAGALYAIGRLVLFAHKESSLVPQGDLAALGAALDKGRVTYFAIANPEHAPYGRAAAEALKSAGLWEKIRQRLVIGENASQAAQFAASGSTDGGLIPYSLALAPAIGERGTFALVPAGAHAPLRQRMALIRGARETARRFYAFVQTPAARAILARHGFAPPPAAE